MSVDVASGRGDTDDFDTRIEQREANCYGVIDAGVGVYQNLLRHCFQSLRQNRLITASQGYAGLETRNSPSRDQIQVQVRPIGLAAVFVDSTTADREVTKPMALPVPGRWPASPDPGNTLGARTRSWAVAKKMITRLDQMSGKERTFSRSKLALD